MNLRKKITLVMSSLAAVLVVVLVTISLYSFRSFSIATATEHLRSAAEIVRVALTEAMINGVIDKRESLIKRLEEVDGLKSARVVRSPLVGKQFGRGLASEETADEFERAVLTNGRPFYQTTIVNGEEIFRGTIPFTATSKGTPNCLQCHQVKEGEVLGAVTIEISIEAMKHKAMATIAWIVGVIAFFALLIVIFVRRLVRPISDTAEAVEAAVQRALAGDFKTEIEHSTKDEIGHIAADMNRLLSFLDSGLNRIGGNVATLTNRSPLPGENLLTATIDAVDILTKAAHFKQAIEEDESKAEIYQRLASVLKEEYGIEEFSIYETIAGKNQIVPVIVDGEQSANCRWCDPQILVRAESCRAARTGHLVDGAKTPKICYAFQPPVTVEARTHICLPLIQSGGVGCVVQLVVKPEDADRLQGQLPFISVYLREAAPVIEAKRLMETLLDANLRDAMTGLNNRRFLEEFIDTLVANVQRRKSPLAILMLDLDYFKMVNDTHGHDAGDLVLKTVAKTLKQCVRASDLVIRYGGEAFLIILLDTDQAGGAEVAEKIRLAIEELKFAVGAATLKKTISIGVSEYPKDSETFWQAVKFADVALYRAKETGRNRVVRFTPDMWTTQTTDY
ncbi:MAG TPA: sensor domain-containing diguanylate cyclase [Rhodocyclaceae bacterium]|nr:sensor domain-containing diguanylate cyclase [Rhodocyclaceae bacterium]